MQPKDLADDTPSRKLFIRDSHNQSLPDSQVPRILWCQFLWVNLSGIVQIHWLRSDTPKSFHIRWKGAIANSTQKHSRPRRATVGQTVVPSGQRDRAIQGKTGSHCPWHVDVSRDLYVCLFESATEITKRVGFDKFENVCKLSPVWVGFFCLFFFSSA